MSVDTTIKEGGNPRAFGRVKRLLVEGGDGKFYPWVPLSDRQLASLSVNKNGVYQAGKMGVYGWRSVSVNVPQTDSVTGKDPATGKEVTITADPETGELVTEPTPVEIRVIEPPTNPYGIYVDGQTIATEGMVVKAYDSDGEELMTVPVGEITLEPDKAVYDPEEDVAWVTADIDTSPVRQPIATRFYVRITGNPSYPLTEVEAYKPMAAIYNTDIPDDTSNVRFMCIIATDQQGELVGKSTRHTTEDKTHTDNMLATNAFTYNGKTAYYAEGMWNSYYTAGEGFIAVEGGYPSIIHAGKIAWALLYGEYTSRGSPQTITVSWPRPGDGAVLETTFDITVGPHGGTGDD